MVALSSSSSEEEEEEEEEGEEADARRPRRRGWSRVEEESATRGFDPLFGKPLPPTELERGRIGLTAPMANAEEGGAFGELLAGGYAGDVVLVVKRGEGQGSGGEEEQAFTVSGLRGGTRTAKGWSCAVPARGTLLRGELERGMRTGHRGAGVCCCEPALGCVGSCGMVQKAGPCVVRQDSIWQRARRVWVWYGSCILCTQMQPCHPRLHLRLGGD